VAQAFLLALSEARFSRPARPTGAEGPVRLALSAFFNVALIF